MACSDHTRGTSAGRRSQNKEEGKKISLETRRPRPGRKIETAIREKNLIS
jgi:hypothetical protein